MSEGIKNNDTLDLIISGFESMDVDGVELVLIGGSQSNGTSGKASDIDVVTIMSPEDPTDIGFDTMIDLSKRINLLCREICYDTKIVPVVVATMRLEEAQIQMGKMYLPDRKILPLHWLHYPSVEFMVENEKLVISRGLFDGMPIVGDVNPIRNNFENALSLQPPVLKKLTGLDWVTDSFRAFLANTDIGNFSRFPQEFSQNHAMHNLHYFWKWDILKPMIDPSGHILDFAKVLEIAKTCLPDDIIQVFNHITDMRHDAKDCSVEEIIDVHKFTFDLWKKIKAN